MKETDMLNFFIEHKFVIVTVLFASSELLALLPGVKSNSIFQLVFGWLKKEKEQEEDPQTPAKLI